MLLCLSFCHKDAELAYRNAQWFATLKNKRPHKVLLACNEQASREGWLRKIHDLLVQALDWDVSTYIPDVENEDEWNQQQRQWPYPQNYLWTNTARYIKAKFNEPWLWLEADAFPLVDYWLDLIELEYQANQQPFMGMFVHTLDHQGKEIPAHMSGVAVYPADIAKWSSRMLLSSGIAFDMVGAEVTIYNMHRTELIHHVYQAPPFDSVEDLKRINPNAVIFHQCKDSSLVERLEEKRGYKLNPAWVEAGPEANVDFNFHPDCVKGTVTQRSGNPSSNRIVEGSTPSGVIPTWKFQGGELVQIA